ncbi:MAG: Crp/Fnr family transcriptional regulator [Elusimicrobia bacterium]|nr:Crp/Fnr family transcriptional regulator [Elusimicrobiota bacterium]
MPDRFLDGLPAFRSLSPVARAELARRLVLRRFRKGEPIFAEGAPAEAVYLLRSGLVKAVKYSPRSAQAAMELIAPGQLFGMIAVMDDKPYPVSALPIAPSEAYRIPARTFAALLAAHPDFSRRVYASVGEHLRQAQALRAISGEKVERRVARVLLTLAESMGEVLRLRREDVAELAGCLPETAIRTLADFRRKGLISSGYKRLTLLDRRRLKALAGPD